MRILILGCGWVGEELALNYLHTSNEVFVTCTTIEKQERLLNMGLQAACVNFDTDNEIENFPKKFDNILVSIPAASRIEQIVLEKRFENLVHFLKGISYRKIIYLSSIGIYPDKDGIYDESCTIELNTRLGMAERVISVTLPSSIIYRLGGLFGKNRIFAKYFQRRICTTGNQPANFVHLDDVIELIKEGFAANLPDSIYNIVAPAHPLKEEVIKISAEKYGMELPLAFEPVDSFQKVVVADKITQALDYTFKYPTPLNF